MILRSFKSVGWVAGVGAAALGCYMLSLQVAAERADLAGVERRIVTTQQAIRNLQTELGTRGRLQQLESWNAEVLALSAPAAGQFVENELVLARFDSRPADPLAADAPVRMASAETGPQAAAAPQATLRQAVAPAPAESAPAQPVVRSASLTTAPATPPAPARTDAKPAARTPAPAPTRTAAATAPAERPARVNRAASLLDERTARELSTAARAERQRPAARTRTADSGD